MLAKVRNALGSLDHVKRVVKVFGMVNSVYRWYRADGRKTAEEVGDQFCALVVDGLVP